MSSSSVAIVVPCYKTELNASERIAYRRIWQIYGHLPIILMVPSLLDTSVFTVEFPAIQVERFEFRTLREYSQLLLQSHFYERFRAYQYILIYQLDCYILRDELLAWCERGYDYIGAPLFHDFEPPQPEGKLWRVGNGGFSLRNINSALKVLSSRKRYQTPQQFWKITESKGNLAEMGKRRFEGLFKLVRFHNNVRWATLCNFHEDLFWSVDALHFLPEFKVPDLETGLAFAFDYAPAYCYERTGFRLPFGCHAWQRYDLSFWQRFIPEAAAISVV